MIWHRLIWHRLTWHRLIRPKSTRSRLGALIALLLVVTGATAGLAGSARAADSTTTTAAGPPPNSFGMRPAGAGEVPGSQGHFVYQVTPGAVIHDAVVVENLTHAPVPVRLYGADLITLEGGGLGVGTFDQPKKSVGAWIQLSQQIVTLGPLGPQGSVTVPFTVTVPAGIAGGDYGGAVVAENSPQRGVQGVAVQTRVALQVQVHVIGAPPTLTASVGPLNVAKDGSVVNFTASFANTGNESFTFDGHVSLSKGGSAVAISVPLVPAKDFLLPGQKVTLSGHWSGAPRFGSVTAHAVVLATPTTGPASTFSDADVTIKFFPWVLVIVAIIALLLLLYVIRQAFRRRQELRARLEAARERRRAVRRFKEGLGSSP